MSQRSDQILDESLHRLAGTGPEWGGGLSNHGPMAAEAMVRMGRANEVEHWVDGYLPRLEEAPRPSARITDDTWRDALGDGKRVADWEAYLGAQLADEQWRDVLARWWPRLVPGLAASATHGIIRTSHAARSLAGDEAANGGPAPERTAELARGLAYWAATYLVLPGAPRPSGQLAPAAAIDSLPRRDTPPGRGLITQVLRDWLSDDAELPRAVAALRPPRHVQQGLLDLSSGFARQFLRYGHLAPIGMLHAVTAPTAARSVLPLLPAEAAGDTYDRLWQLGAALVSAYSSGATARPFPAGQPPAADDLADRAIVTGDEHAIKLTEACLRLHAEQQDPLLLHAAALASEVLAR
jgi:hypothetical protein